MSYLISLVMSNLSQVLAPPQICCVTLGRSLPLSELLQALYIAWPLLPTTTSVIQMLPHRAVVGLVGSTGM